jgi:hypothetical protein
VPVFYVVIQGGIDGWRLRRQAAHGTDRPGGPQAPGAGSSP